jgi:hypothetical protein
MDTKGRGRSSTIVNDTFTGKVLESAKVGVAVAVGVPLELAVGVGGCSQRAISSSPEAGFRSS